MNRKVLSYSGLAGTLGLFVATSGCQKALEWLGPDKTEESAPAASGVLAPGAAPAASSAPALSASANEVVEVAGEADESFIYTRKLTRAELEKKTLRELSLIRNTVYAKRGHGFVKDWLKKYFEAQPWYQAVRGKEVKRPFSDAEQHNVNLVAEVEASLSRAELTARAAAIRKRVEASAARPHDELELRLISARLGEWVGTPQQTARSPLEDIRLLDGVLSLEQLENMSLRDLRTLRNTVYARRGRAFKSPILQQYFHATSWYKEDKAYSDARLTATDWKNIKLIQSVEQKLGGPIVDSDPTYQRFWASYMSGA